METPIQNPTDVSTKSRIPRLTRRRFLTLTGLAAVGVGVYTWRVEPHWIELVERDLPIRNLPPDWVGRKLVQISDIHVGPVVDTAFLESAIQRLSDLHADMIVITGDFMSCRGMEQIDAATRLMERLPSVRYGCFAILGNHDYSLGWSNAQVADRLTARLTDIGIRVLRNEFQVVAGMQLVGLDDFWGPNFRPGDVLPNVDWEKPALTLCHNPDAVDRPSLAVCRGWILSGHTHGGQCKPPFLPPPMLPVENKRYTCGEFDLGDGRWLYINRGLGYLRRVRFNMRPEITVFRMCSHVSEPRT
jgi:predicted MPP superfamily phosphohydrolase